MTLSIIVAIADNGVIGHNNQLPWDCPKDLKHFRRVTLHHAVIMGRKTYESLNGHNLDHRKMIVVSSNPNYVVPEYVDVVPTLDAAIKRANDCGYADPIVIGGKQLYEAAFQYASTCFITRIHLTPVGDVCYQPDLTGWECVSKETHQTEDFAYQFTHEKWVYKI